VIVAANALRLDVVNCQGPVTNLVGAGSFAIEAFAAMYLQSRLQRFESTAWGGCAACDLIKRGSIRLQIYCNQSTVWQTIQPMSSEISGRKR
jgi:hypothetical protein